MTLFGKNKILITITGLLVTVVIILSMLILLKPDLVIHRKHLFFPASNHSQTSDTLKDSTTQTQQPHTIIIKNVEKQQLADILKILESYSSSQNLEALKIECFKAQLPDSISNK